MAPKNAPAGFGGLPGHLLHRMLVVGFDRRGDVTKLRLNVRLIGPHSLASQRKAPLSAGLELRGEGWPIPPPSVDLVSRLTFLGSPVWQRLVIQLC